MKRALFSKVFLLWVSTGAWSQVKVVQSVYFASGKHALTFIIRNAIDSTLNAIPETDSSRSVFIRKVFVNGYTDNVGDSSRNIELSQKRTGAVVAYLLKKGISKNAIKQNFWGEDRPARSNENEEGKLFNRRVDIIVKYEIVGKKQPMAPAVPATVIDRDPCKRDTLVDIPLGGKLRMRLCDYLKSKGCLIFEQVDDPAAIRRGNNYTLDNTGTPLISGGMYNIKVCRESCSGKLVTLYVPVRTLCGFELPVPMQLFFSSNRGWQAVEKAQMRERRIDGMKYYEVTLDLCRFSEVGGGGINCDFKISKRNTKKAKFIAHAGIKIIEASIYSAGPLYSYPMNVSHKRKIASCRIPCSCQEPLAYIKALSPGGDTLIIKDKPINSLSRKYTRGKCKTGGYVKGVKNLGIFKIREKAIYRKYFLYELDFENFKIR